MKLYILHFATLVNQLSISSIAKLTKLSLFTLSCRYLIVQTSRPSFTPSLVVSLLSVSMLAKLRDRSCTGRHMT